MATASGITGFTLPGMMLLPGCSAGSLSSPRPASGPLFIEAQVIADLHERHGERAQLTGEFHRGVLRTHGGEVV